MLVQFKVGNYLSFKEPVTLSLVASSDDHLPQNTFPVPGIDGTSLLKSVAIYGANASGKSNLLKAFQFMGQFVTESAVGRQEGDAIEVTPFKLDPEYLARPSEFEVMFIHEQERYGLWLQGGQRARPRRMAHRRENRDTREVALSLPPKGGWKCSVGVRMAGGEEGA